MSIPDNQEIGDRRLPVTVVTGFLGSGKTTLLSALLRRSDLGRVAVIINEFGEVPLDQIFIERTFAHVVVLSGGCLCCAMTGDVISTLLELHARRGDLPFDRVIIETSGLADPGPILAPLLQAPELTGRFRVSGVVTLVDALQGLRELNRHRVSAKQVALADRVILSKSDIAAPRAVHQLHRLLRTLNPWAPIAIANHGKVDGDWLFKPRFGAPVAILDDHQEHPPQGEHDHHGIRSFCLSFDRPVAWAAFAGAIAALTELHGENILRIKGLLNQKNQARPVAVHGVQRILHPPVTVEEWPDDDRRSRLVFITDHLHEAVVRPFFAPFLADQPHDAAIHRDLIQDGL